MNNAANGANQVISMPKGGGALSGIGETFSPDLHTGTGNFTVPIALPAGRNGFQPELNLVYSTGHGNGPFGLGWSLSIPGVSRKTSDGVPHYNEAAQNLAPGVRRDVFILSGAEDLVPVEGNYPGLVQYRPRTEGLFARITHHRGQTLQDNYWKVESKDGLVSFYGQSPAAATEPAVVTKPDDPARIFSWKLTETHDPFGNLIRYHYQRDAGHNDGHRWDQPLLKQICYVDYGDSSAEPKFLVTVDFEYDDDRPDPFSDYRAGFEIRTTKRCRAIKVVTHTQDEQDHPVREYRFTYAPDPYNDVSLLQQLDVIGYDDAGNAYDGEDDSSPSQKLLPPLTFGYTRFSPEEQTFTAVSGSDLPVRSLGTPDLELVDLHGSGLPDILEMKGTVRYWRNLGHGQFDLPRPMREAPAHALADPGVQLIDANGDGRLDLLVTSTPLAGYYPLTHTASWDRTSFQAYKDGPTFNLEDPEVRLVDLDGDGLTDILRSGTRLECFFNDPDPRLAWQRTHFAPRRALEDFPNVNFSDPRVKLADMTDDGLQDIVIVYDGNIEYWPNLGHGRWGRRIHMRHGPRFPYGYDPQRILVGDVDGDGLADLVYVDHCQVTLWINQSGNGWSEPIEIQGTPPVTNLDAVRLVDLYGTGISGVLWSREADGLSRQHMFFLDFSGGIKPYLLNQMDNHMGAVTQVEYKPSTHYYLEDQKTPQTRWRTPLPFPVQVVAKVEVIDEVSQGKLTTEYRYHHGYWDGAEREFRGFGMVEQLDTERFEDYHAAGLHSDVDGFHNVSEKQFASPTLTKTWFHQGPVGEAYGDWAETDYIAEYWPDDPQLLDHTAQVDQFLSSYNDRPHSTASPRNRRIKRDALRTLRGSILRTELYALDGSERQARPYTVTEHAYGLREIAAPTDNANRPRIFFPHLVAQRTTQWERGDDPMTQFAFTGDYDDYGQPRRQTAVAMPRLLTHQQPLTGAVIDSLNPNETQVLATHSRTEYATPQTNDLYIHDRVAQVKQFELANPPPGPDALTDDLLIALRKQWDTAQQVRDMFDDPAGPKARLIGHEVHHYDEPDDEPGFVGLPAGQLGDHGALIRSEALVFTAELLDQAYPDRRPGYLAGTASLPANAPAGFGANIGYRQEGAVPGRYESGYYTDTLRQRLSSRGLPLAVQDALGHETVITYDDPYHLLPIKVTDAIGLETRAGYNYHLLQPHSMTEPNGNTTHVLYNPIGLPHKQYVTGLDSKGGETLGGTADKPEISFEYNFRNFERAGKPIFVHTTRRIHHARDNLSDDTIESREYSDGYGRLIQTRAQAEDLVFGEFGGEVGLTPQSDSTPGTAAGHRVADSVVVSGWELFDNKGRVVEKYEPFFSQGWAFQAEVEAKKGQHASLFYDPRGQVIRSLNPDGSQQRVIFGRPRVATALTLTRADLESTGVPAGFDPSPWESYTYDPNDLAGLTHPNTTAAPTPHHDTPASVVLDPLGRARCAVARNGPTPANDWFITQSSYDIRGNLLTVTDALGRTAFAYHYDLLDRALSVDSIDAGRRTSVFDALGSLIEFHDSKGSLVLRTYDAMNRLRELWARNDSVGAFTLRERIIYGDEGDRGLAQRYNTLGRPVKHYDEAGVLELPRYDFKGNLLQKSRRTIKDDALAQPNGWLADWSADTAEEAIEAAAYQTDTRYDALNRPIEITYPQDVDGQRQKLRPRYNRAGALEAVKLNNDDYVQHIAYNARGQRVLIAYGNGLMTRQAYDTHTFRLIRLRTEGFSHSTDATASSETWHGNGQLIQDFSYRYDLAGNITHIDERTPNCGVANSPDRLLREFSYDPLYRLLSATGRACKDIGAPRPLTDDPRWGFYPGGPATPDPANAPNLTERYIESYTYDPAGNMLTLAYQAGSRNWTRRFGLGDLSPDQWAVAPNNRLTSLETGPVTQNYSFDDSGNLLHQNSDKHHTWDHADRMTGYRVQANDNSPPSVKACYLYGADGMRVKKWVRNQQGQVNTTTYIDGLFEQHHLKNDGEDKTNNTLHVMDDQSRIALVRVGPPLGDRDASPQVQYHLGDHLGSSHVVVGGNDSHSNVFINREEYFPYGETSFGSFGQKRYRYSGKERDEESGLYYYGARYLAPWLGRWVSCDPAGAIDGLDLYRGFRNSPIVFHDDVGTNTEADEVDTMGAEPETDQVHDPNGEQPEEPSAAGKPSLPSGFMGKLKAIVFSFMLWLSDEEPPPPIQKTLPGAVEEEGEKNRRRKGGGGKGDGGKGGGKGGGKDGGSKGGGARGIASKGIIRRRGSGGRGSSVRSVGARRIASKGIRTRGSGVRGVGGAALHALDVVGGGLEQKARLDSAMTPEHKKFAERELNKRGARPIQGTDLYIDPKTGELLKIDPVDLWQEDQLWHPTVVGKLPSATMSDEGYFLDWESGLQVYQEDGSWHLNYWRDKPE